MKSKRANRLYGIIGTSIEHSLSPLIYNFLAERYGINGIYSVFDIDRANLAKAIRAVRVLDIKGLNVTQPFKVDIIKYLDKLDKSAADIGAVNTIKNANGVLTGYNTDRFGIETTLSNLLEISPRQKNIIIIGAGGAARACLRTLVKSGPTTITIVNRSLKNARRMVMKFAERSAGIQLKAVCMDDIFNINKVNKFSLIINAITADKIFTVRLLHTMQKSGLLDGTCFFDINYGNRAVSKGLPRDINRSIDGLYMLAAQAARSFQIWHRRKVDIDAIYTFLNNG
jgi:shikimate dehydrogenase